MDGSGALYTLGNMRDLLMILAISSVMGVFTGLLRQAVHHHGYGLEGVRGRELAAALAVEMLISTGAGFAAALLVTLSAPVTFGQVVAACFYGGLAGPHLLVNVMKQNWLHRTRALRHAPDSPAPSRHVEG